MNLNSSKGATDSLAKPVEAEILASLEESDISRNDRFDKVKSMLF